MKLIPCKICKTTIKVSPKLERSGRGKYCSRDCYYKSRKCVIKRKCSNCNNSIVMPRWRDYVGKKYYFCSTECYSKFRKTNPWYKRQRIDEHPILTKKLLEKEYTEKKIKMKDIAQKYKLSYVTVNSWIKRYGIPTRQQKDYLSHNHFNSITRKIKKERGDKCQVCSWDKAQCDVHHKTKRKDGGTDKESNLIILCPNCHRLADQNKLKI